MFLPHFDILCDLLLNRCTATWNLFVLYHKETNFYSSFISKSFVVTCKPALPTKKPFDIICCLYKMKARPILCLVYSRSASCWLRLLRSFSFKETSSYFFLLLVPIQCLDKAFMYLTFAKSHKYYLNYAILKHRRKNFELMTSIVCLSCNRTWARSYQNARVTCAIIL